LVPNLDTDILLQKNNDVQCNLCKLLLALLIVVIVVRGGGGGGGGRGIGGEGEDGRRRRKRSIDNGYSRILCSYYHCSFCVVKMKSNCGLFL